VRLKDELDEKTADSRFGALTCSRVTGSSWLLMQRVPRLTQSKKARPCMAMWLSENATMLQMLRRLCFSTRMPWDRNIKRVVLDLNTSPA